jgi:hypothetical protein
MQSAMVCHIARTLSCSDDHEHAGLVRGGGEGLGVAGGRARGWCGPNAGLSYVLHYIPSSGMVVFRFRGVVLVLSYGTATQYTMR